MGQEMSFPINFKKFEVEITNRCNVKCPRCARTVFLEDFPTLWKNYDLSLDDFAKFIKPRLPEIETFQFKGTNGDPIFHPNFIQWVEWCKENNKAVQIHTNGNAGKNLWNNLVGLLDKSDRVILAIDGIPNNFMKYRINAKWENIVTCAEILKNKCTLEWQYIIFSYNYKNIDEAKAISKAMGFDKFEIYKSDRWEENDWLKPPENFVEESTYNKADSYTLEPDCLNKSMHIVSADGYYIPCCHLVDHRWRYKTPWSNTFNIKKCTINNIINSQVSNEFFNKLNDKMAPNYCKVSCNKCEI